MQQEETLKLPIKKILLAVVALITLIITAVNRPFATVDSSERGIVYRLGAVQDEVL